MTEGDVASVLRQFHQAFAEHDFTLLSDLVAEDCVMESIQPAPDGTRYEGREACLGFWKALAADTGTTFEQEEVVVAGDRAIICWRARFAHKRADSVFSGQQADSVRGVNLMHIRDGLIVSALGYAKTA